MRQTLRNMAAEDPALQESKLEVIALNSQSDTCSSVSGFSVRSGESDEDPDSPTPKRLESPGLHEHAVAALHLTS